MNTYSALIKQNSANYPYCVAYKTSGTTITGGPTIITSYNSVSPNAASGTIFNLTDGQFVAPVKGLYQFNVNFSVENQSSTSGDTMRFGLVCSSVFTGPTEIYAYDEMEEQPSGHVLLKSISGSFMMSPNATVGLYYQDMQDTLIVTQITFNGYLVAAFN